MARSLDNLPVQMGQAVLAGEVVVTFGRHYCARHQALMVESSRSTLAMRPAQTAYRCPEPNCRLEAWL